MAHKSDSELPKRGQEQPASHPHIPDKRSEPKHDKAAAKGEAPARPKKAPPN